MKAKYIKTNWVDNKTPLDASHLNKIENGIETLYEQAPDKSEIKAGTNIKIDETTLGELKISTTSDVLTKNNVINSLGSTETDKPLAASKGKELNESKANRSELTAETSAREAADEELKERVDNISSLGRFLSVWNCQTGFPYTDPENTPYTYKTGDYYIVGKLAEYPVWIEYKLTGESESIKTWFYTKYGDLFLYGDSSSYVYIEEFTIGKNVYNSVGSVIGTLSAFNTVSSENDNQLIPSGPEYTKARSTTINRPCSKETPKLNDLYRYDGSSWVLLSLEDKKTLWGSIEGDISQQLDLMMVFNVKQDVTDKVTSLSSSSTNNQYPSAKCVYDFANTTKTNTSIASSTGSKTVNYNTLEVITLENTITVAPALNITLSETGKYAGKANVWWVQVFNNTSETATINLLGSSGLAITPKYPGGEAPVFEANSITEMQIMKEGSSIYIASYQTYK